MNKVFDILIEPRTEEEIIENVKIKIADNCFTHVVSLNPEILVMTNEKKDYQQIIEAAQVKLVDGVGVVIASMILGIDIGERVTGVGLMEKLLHESNEISAKVLILGGKQDVASELANKIQLENRKLQVKGMQGYKNVNKPTTEEEQSVLSLLIDFQPQIIFVAFGAPAQDFWIYNHKNAVNNAICMSVGGAVDYLAGKVPRAPKLIRIIGFEWLFRLLVQPWRWRRQLKLITFFKLVLQQRFSKYPA